MTSAQSMYAGKLVSADEAVRLISNNNDIAIGLVTAEPPALLAALARRVEAGEINDVRTWYMLAQAHAGATIMRPEMLGKIQPKCMFMGGVERGLIKNDPAAKSRIDFVPAAFSNVPRIIRDEQSMDVCLITVSSMDEDGYFSFGGANDYTSVAAHTARTVIVEVNPAMPRVACSTPLHISKVTAVVENHTQLLSFGEQPTSAQDEAIAGHISKLVDDGMCLQMGIGNLPSAVCSKLANRKDMGIHTELLTPAMARLMHSGAVNNRLKATHTGQSVYAFAMGDEPFYNWMHNNERLYSLPVDIVNDPAEIAKNDRVLSVNATIQIDLEGACNSEFMAGQQYSAAGGQLDFVRGAYASRGGVSIIACHSTARGGAVSRIVPRLDGPVTTPRNDVQWIITEHGAVNLRGKSIRERAELLISIADPKFRDELEKAL